MVHQTPATTIQEWLDAHTPFVFIDVRTQAEWQLARVEGSQLLTQATLPDVEALPKQTRLAFLCHHGIRSDAAAHHFARLGFSDVHNIIGGIEAWSCEVDADVPRY